MDNMLINQLTNGLYFLTRADNFKSKSALFWYFFNTVPRRLGGSDNIKEEITVSIGGVTFCFLTNSSELYSYRDIFKEEVYEKHPRTKLNDQKIIIDIGANIGFYTLKAALRMPSCKIYSFEPNPDTYNRLLKNIELNKLGNVFPFQQAVNSIDGVVKFKKDAQSWTSHIAVDDEYNSEDLITVDAVMLDDFLVQHGVDLLDLLKIDAEGAEYDILLGARKSLKKIKTIVLEYHSNELLVSIKDYLEDNGFYEILRECAIYNGSNMGYLYYLNREIL